MWEDLVAKYGPWALFALLYYQEKQTNKALNASILAMAIAGTATVESFKTMLSQFLASQHKP